jgi:hypothetical protein
MAEEASWPTPGAFSPPDSTATACEFIAVKRKLARRSRKAGTDRRARPPVFLRTRCDFHQERKADLRVVVRKDICADPALTLLKFVSGKNGISVDLPPRYADKTNAFTLFNNKRNTVSTTRSPYDLVTSVTSRTTLPLVEDQEGEPDFFAFRGKDYPFYLFELLDTGI